MRIKRIKEKADIFTSAFSNNTQSSERTLFYAQPLIDIIGNRFAIPYSESPLGRVPND